MALQIIKSKNSGLKAMQAMRALAKGNCNICAASEIAANDPHYDSAIIPFINAKYGEYKAISPLSTVTVPISAQTDIAYEIAQLAFENSIPGQLMKLGAKVVPFGCKVSELTATGADWVGTPGEGKAVKVSGATVTASRLEGYRLSAILVVTDELMRAASPGTDQALRDVMITEATKKIDALFLSSSAAVANTSPAGIMPAKGVADVPAMFKEFADNGNMINGAVLVMPVADTLKMGVDAYANYTKLGVTVLPSQFAKAQMLINPAALAINYIGAEIDVSTECTVDLSDAPGGANPVVVSAFQDNIAVYKLTQFVGWAHVTGKAVSMVEVKNA